MADREKIVLLSRLAVYDKHMSESDKKTNNYFMHDYIYSRNVRTRFFALLGSLIIIIFYAVNKILIQKADIFELDYKKEITAVIVFTVLVLILYTVIGGLKAASEYRAGQKRIKAYLEVLSKAGSDKSDKITAHEGTRKERHGRDIIYTGGNYKRY